MTRIDFYILSTDNADARLRVACRIAHKAVQRRHHVFVNAADEGDANRLDDLLWTFSQGSFIPHLVAGRGLPADGDEPVVIGVVDPGASDDPPAEAGEYWDVMINLAGDVPGFFGRYARVAEVVDADPARRSQGRQRYRYYQERGYKLQTHSI